MHIEQADSLRSVSGLTLREIAEVHGFSLYSVRAFSTSNDQNLWMVLGGVR